MSNAYGSQEGSFQPPFDASQEVAPPVSRFDGLRERLETYAAVGIASGVLLVEAAAMAWGSKPEPTAQEIIDSSEALKKRSASEIGPGRKPTEDETKRTAEALGMSVEEVERQAPRWWR